MMTIRNGYDLLNEPLLNKGTAFSESERDTFGLHGLLPPLIATLDEQVSRRLQAFRQLSTVFERYVSVIPQVRGDLLSLQRWIASNWTLEHR